MESEFDTRCTYVAHYIAKKIERVCNTTVLSNDKSKKYRFKVDGKFTKSKRDEISWLVFELCHVSIRWGDSNTVEADLEEVMDVIPSW